MPRRTPRRPPAESVPETARLDARGSSPTPGCPSAARAPTPRCRPGLGAALGPRSGSRRSPTPTATPCPAGVADQILQLILDLLAVLGAHVHLVVVTVESELDGLDPLGLVLVQSQVITTCTFCATDSFPCARPRGRVAEHGADSAGHRNLERSRSTTVRQTSDMEERTALPSHKDLGSGVSRQRGFLIHESGNGGCHHQGSSSTVISVTHFTHQNPRRFGATRRAGKPCPADSGLPPS